MEPSGAARLTNAKNWRAEAVRHGLEILPELPAVLTDAQMGLVEAATARTFSVIPLGRDAEGSLKLAAASAADAREHLPELEFALGRVRVFAAEPPAVHALLARHYAIKNIPLLESTGAETNFFSDAPDGETLGSATGIASYVESVLGYAVRTGASDVHFEASQEGFGVRMRIDGVLKALRALPRAAGPAVLARLKVMSGMDIGVSRKAQDGRIQGRMGGRAVDIRMATLPTVCGECAVLRILDASRRGLDILSLGMPDGCLSELDRVCSGHGLVLACGPTGSGKTTTLHAALRNLDADSRKILTVEDPVEYELPGSVQVQARPEIGLDFHRALRSFLRHDPDVMLVGEIRDAETARIAMRAAMTGHLVLASLHCTGAAEAAVRLVELGLEPWRVGSALELSIAQRLVRKICPACRGEGCAECGGTGFRGRIAVFEWLCMNAKLGALLDSGSMPDYMNAARAAMKATMADAGLELVRQGWTTMEELAAQVDLHHAAVA